MSIWFYIHSNVPFLGIANLAGRSVRSDSPCAQQEPLLSPGIYIDRTMSPCGYYQEHSPPPFPRHQVPSIVHRWEHGPLSEVGTLTTWAIGSFPLRPDSLSELVIVGVWNEMGVMGRSIGLRVSSWVEKWSTFHALITFGSVALFSERTRRQIMTGIMLWWCET